MTERRATRSEIDGVPLLIIERDGPVEAALVFRVGRGDDGLPNLGLSHLVEHLALHAIEDRDYEFNGRVSNLTTVFNCRGTLDEVQEFLSSVCTALSHLPEKRLELELRVLSIETRNTGLPDLSNNVVARFGTTGIGASSYPDFGADAMTFDKVDDFRRQFFTRQNAVVVMTSAPKSLNLDLPDGQRCVPPKVHQSPRDYPASIPSYEGVGLSIVAPRSSAFSCGVQILERRLQNQMRSESGLTYTVQGDYARLDAQDAIAWLSADIEDAPEQAAWNAFAREVQKFAAVGPTADEYDWLQRQRGRQAQDDATIFGQLIAEAEDLLLGNQISDELPTLDEIKDVMATAIAKALYEVPYFLGAPPGLPAVKFESAPRVEGRRFDKRYSMLRNTYWIAGDDGISEVTIAGTDTILWKDVVLVQEYSDTSILILDQSGLPIALEPDLLRRNSGLDLVSLIQDKVAHDRFVYVDMGGTDPYEADDLDTMKRLGRRFAGPFHQRLRPNQVFGFGVSLVAAVLVFLIFGDTETVDGYPAIGSVLFFGSAALYAIAGILNTIQSRKSFLVAIPAVVLMFAVGWLDREWSPNAAQAELIFAVMTGVGFFATWLLQPRAPHLYPTVSKPVRRRKRDEGLLTADEDEGWNSFQVTEINPEVGLNGLQLALGIGGPKRLSTTKRVAVPLLWLLGFVFLVGFSAETEPTYPLLWDAIFTVVVIGLFASIILSIFGSPWGIYAGLLTGVTGVLLGLADRSYDPPNANVEVYVFGAAAIMSLVLWPWSRRESAGS